MANYRRPAKPFEPGNKLSPGRPRVDPDAKELARALTPMAIKCLSECVKSKKAPWAARVAAANSLVDRGYGKAPQHITAELSIVERMTDDERTALLGAIGTVLENIEPGESGIAASRAAQEIGDPEGTA